MATTPNAAKAAVVTEVKQMLSGVDAALITEYRGLSVGSLSTLRRALRPLGAEYKVYKNTLASRAAQEAGFEGLSQFLVGPTAITFVKGDASAAAKAFFKSATPENTADSGSKRRPTASASKRAIVVLPVPGGPQRIMDDSLPAASIRPIAPCGPVKCSWPTTSLIAEGRSRSASGAGGPS